MIKSPKSFDSAIIGKEPGAIFLFAKDSYLCTQQFQEIEKSSIPVSAFDVFEMDPVWLNECGVCGVPFWIFYHSDYIVLRAPGLLLSESLSAIFQRLSVMDITPAKTETGEIT